MTKHYSILGLSLFMLSTAPILVKLTSSNALALVSWRLLFVSLLLLPFMLRNIEKASLSQVKNIIPVGIFLFLHFYMWFRGIPKMSIAVAMIIYATNPIYTSILSYIFLREPLERKHFMAFGLSICGIFFAYKSKLSNGLVNLEGGVEILLAAIFYSAYMTFSKKNRNHLNNNTFSFYLNLITMLISFGVLILTNIFFQGEINWTNFDQREWLIIFSLALFPSVLGHTMMIYLLPFFNINFLSVIKLLSPLLSALWAYFIFSESLSAYHLLGFFCIAISVILTANFNIKKALSRIS